MTWSHHVFLLPEELVERLVFLKAVDIRLERRKKISRTTRLFEKNWLTYLQVGKKQRNLLPMTIF